MNPPWNDEIAPPGAPVVIRNDPFVALCGNQAWFLNSWEATRIIIWLGPPAVLLHGVQTNKSVMITVDVENVAWDVEQPIEGN